MNSPRGSDTPIFHHSILPHSEAIATLPFNNLLKFPLILLNSSNSFKDKSTYIIIPKQ